MMRDILRSVVGESQTQAIGFLSLRRYKSGEEVLVYFGAMAFVSSTFSTEVSLWQNSDYTLSSQMVLERHF